MPTIEQIVARYDRGIQRLIRSQLRRQAADMRRIRASFSDFRSRALDLIPASVPIDRAIIVSVLRDLSSQIDALTTELGLTISGGVREIVRTSDLMAQLYGETFNAIDIVGIDLDTFDIATRFSADLIDLGTGGLRAQIQTAVRQQLALAALGASGGQFSGVEALNVALGGPRKWTFRAERIYRTEVLRVQSLSMQASISRMNEITPTRKKWVWSGADRPEHARIDQQTVAANRKFRVPLRTGGSVLMRFPRDPAAPPSATINCGCFVVPVPGKKVAAPAAAA